MTYRKIIHIDLDAFYCAVEELSNPSLRTKPFVVGGRPDQRGVVSSCSYAARKFGIRSAMPTARAVQLCPDLIIIRGNHRSYSQYSQQVMTLLRSFTTQVEQISIDEAFLDVSEIPDSSENIARRIQELINSESKLPCSLGVSTNKLVAKVATDVGKAANTSKGSPNAIQIVPPGKEAEFLAPLPVEMLWGVGPKTAIQLSELNIFLIGDITNFPETYLVEKFGKFGHALYYRSRGIDNRDIITSHITKSVSCETTFSQDISDEDTLLSQLKYLANRVSKRLQKQRLSGLTVKIKLRWSDFSTFSRQTTLKQPTNQLDPIYEAAKYLFKSNWVKGKPVRLLGVGVSRLCPPIKQLSLWESSSLVSQLNKEKQLRIALSHLHEKFGENIIHWGTTQEK